MFDPVLIPLDGSLVTEDALWNVAANPRAFDVKVLLLRR